MLSFFAKAMIKEKERDIYSFFFHGLKREIIENFPEEMKFEIVILKGNF